MPSKNLGQGKCVHCLKEVEERNSDHVFPESWYPASTPPDVEKWQIPSCIPCNSDYGKLEQDFLIKVGLCLDPHHPASASIVQKALRSVKPRPRAIRATPGIGLVGVSGYSRKRSKANRFQTMVFFPAWESDGLTFPASAPLHSPSRPIDARIAALSSRRGETLARVRSFIR